VTDFVREGACRQCGREYMVAGASLNPGAETEAPASFRCACGGRITAFVPGSVNREKLVLRPRDDEDDAALA
jgi:hypothetical protein